MGGVPPASCSCYNTQHSCCAASSSDAKASSKPSDNGNLEFHPPKDFAYDDEEKDNIQRDKDGANVSAIVAPNSSGAAADGQDSSRAQPTSKNGISIEIIQTEVHDSKDPRNSVNTVHSSTLSVGGRVPGDSKASIESKDRDRCLSDGARSPSAHSSPDSSPSKVKHHRIRGGDPDAADFAAVGSQPMGYRSSNPRNVSVHADRRSVSSSKSSCSYSSESSSPLSALGSTAMAPVGSMPLGQHSSKLPSTPELHVVRSQNSDDTIAGSCFVDEVQGRRPGTPRPSKREDNIETITHSISRHSLISKGTVATVATTYSTGTTRSKSLFNWTDPEQEYKEYRKSVHRMPSRSMHLNVFAIPEANPVQETAVGEISTIPE